MACTKAMAEGTSPEQACPISCTASVTEECTPGLYHSHCSRSKGTRSTTYTTKL